MLAKPTIEIVLSGEISLTDSRRITGPHRVLPGPGALLDVAIPVHHVTAAIALWREELDRILLGVGWQDADVRAMAVAGGACLGFTAPVDALYAATEVNEWAWQSASARLLDRTVVEDLPAAVVRLGKTILEESNPRLQALCRKATGRNVTLLSDDDQVSIGLGTGSRTWDLAQLPLPEEVPWEDLFDVPVLLVTGTNGKTTTIRLLAAIAQAAGQCPGFSSTDGVWVAGELIHAGDYSGPGGARTVLRDPRVTLALLETARGGLLRRGVAVQAATGSAVTNIAADHLGEFGAHDVDAIADTKCVITGLTSEPGSVVLNGDDARLVARGRELSGKVSWFSLDPNSTTIQECLQASESASLAPRACVLRGEQLVLYERGRDPEVLVNVGEVPIAVAGAARHNIANCLAAIALARVARLPLEAIRQGLRQFNPTPASSPGRGNWFEIRGVTVYVDFAHNAHGYEALVDMAQRLEYRRCGILLGQAGDRDDESTRDLVRVAWRLRPDRVVVKEMECHLRGREVGEVPALIADALQDLGAPAESVSMSPTEFDAVQVLLHWAQPGDLLLLPLHAQRDAVLAELIQLST